MKDYFGKNGCYDLEKVGEEDDDRELLRIYLNSPIVYNSVLGGEMVRETSENREWPDVEFVIEKIPGNGDGEYIVHSMEVTVLGCDGVNEFVAALLTKNIDEKDDLILAVKQLLNEANAVWGIINPDEEIDN